MTEIQDKSISDTQATDSATETDALPCSAVHELALDLPLADDAPGGMVRHTHTQRTHTLALTWL